MKYPAKIKIKRTQYSIQIVDVCPGGPELYGECLGDNKIIFIKKGYSKRFTFEIFLHEVMHALEYEYGFRIPHDIINQLESPLRRMLFENFKIQFKKK